MAAATVAGTAAPLLLVAAPFVPATESALTGAVLCGFALGWVVLFLLSTRFTDQPQRWAVAPALFLALGGLLLLGFGPPMREVLSWVWPPAMLALVVWTATRVRRDVRGRGARVSFFAVLTVMGVCASGGAWQTVRETTEPNPYLASGQLVDVGGHRLRLDCVGTGSPTVVLEPGAGATSATMGWVAPMVARETRVCVYDRAGRGGSEVADGPHDGVRVATDLHTLLQRADVPGPYVLVGHSFGGLYVRIFAARYPTDVAGLVLVDSTASREPARPATVPGRGDGSADAVSRISVLVSLSARVGLTRLYGDLAGGSLPTRSEDLLRYDTAQATTVRSVVEEYVRGAGPQEAASLRDLGGKPLAVLTAGEGHPASWLTAQRETTALSSNSVQRVVAGATHEEMVGDEQHAAATAKAVVDVVLSVRSDRPISQWTHKILLPLGRSA